MGFNATELGEGIACKLCFNPDQEESETELFYSEEDAIRHYLEAHGIVIIQGG